MKKWKLIFFVLAVVGIWWWRLKATEIKYPGEGAKIEITGTLLEEPRMSGGYESFRLQSVEIRTKGKEYHYGERLRVIGRLRKRVINSRKTVFSVSFPEIYQLERKSANQFLLVIDKARQRIVETYQKVLPEPEASLLAGIVLGVRAQMPKDFYEDLIKTGTLHVIAASGMNVTMVAGLLFLSLQKLAGKIWAVILAVMGVIFYVFLAGASAAVVRAGIMGLVVCLAVFLGRKFDAWRALVMTVILMAWWSAEIVWDIGFQLSVTAMVGILLLQIQKSPPAADPPLAENIKNQNDKLKCRNLREKVWKRMLEGIKENFGEGFRTAVAATIMTLPVILVNFGRLSLLSALVNGLLIWMILPLMIFGGLIGLMGFVSQALAMILAPFVYGLLVIFVWVTRWFGSLPGASIDLPNLPLFLAGGYYLVVGMILKLKRLR